MDMLLEILGVSIGLVYLFWEYKADPKMWIASIVMPMISMWLYFSKGIYADFAINIYYMLIAVYGYWNWTRKRPGGGGSGGGESTLPITHVGLKVAAGCVAAVALLWGAIAWILVNYTDSTIPYVDAFTTAMSIVGLWMGARKYCEQWLIWLIVNVVTVPMQLSKGLVFYPCLYTVYAVISIFGYRNWLRIMRKSS